MRSGYTKAYRKELESDIWKMSPLYQRVFYYLRQKATWKPETFPTRLGFGIALNPGQLITSLSSIADGVSWYEYGVKKTPNKKTIKAILDWLESNSMVTVESNRYGTFINIINWNSYNSIEMEKVTPSNQPLVTPSKHQLDTLKEVKEVKEINIKEKYSDFVFLTKDEYKKLLKEFGDTKLKRWIETLNNYIGSKGKKYKSHYHTILNWERRENPTQPKKHEPTIEELIS